MTDRTATEKDKPELKDAPEPAPPKPMRDNPGPVRIDGPTPNGGAYMITFTNYDGTVETVEFGADGTEVARNPGMPEAAAPKGKGKHEPEHEPKHEAKHGHEPEHEAKHRGFGR